MLEQQTTMLDLSIVTPLYLEKKMFISHLNLYAYEPPQKRKWSQIRQTTTEGEIG
jgi:hypothetical protein